ncbi:MAG: lysine--tRNA ligase [Paracoccaceae bacterium]
MKFDNNILSQTNSWPFFEAKRVLKRLSQDKNNKTTVTFQTGYGPSGLPHIGTFGEVVRTNMVRKAFSFLSEIQTRLICFSDDLDGLRKIPTNVPSPKKLEDDLDLPLTKVRDPFGRFNSFADHNNSKLKEFLDNYNLDYSFESATKNYKDGLFDNALIKILENYEKIMEVILPSLRDERKKTYSPFLPISPISGKVLQVAIEKIDKSKGNITYIEPCGEKIELSVKSGNVKLQWKPDWAMRWFALDVDYEMFGKDLIPSAELASKICRIIGGKPPELLNYELFLDEHGQKISKSKGNGLSIEDWLRYADQDSLSFFMFQKPKTAKRLYFDIIPKMVDDYHQNLNKFIEQKQEDKINNAVWHIHNGNPPVSNLIISFSMILNLVSASGSEDEKTLWTFIKRYKPNIVADNHPDLKKAVKYAINYYQDFVKPTKKFRTATSKERDALIDLHSKLENLNSNCDIQEIQTLLFSIGKDHNFDNLRDWFSAFYEVILGTKTGPRLGGFISIYGIEETRTLIYQKLNF